MTAANPRSPPWRTTDPHRSSRSAPALDQFDLVTIRILDEGDDGRAVLHRSGLAHHLAATGADVVARLRRVLDLERDVAVGGAELVLVHAPVVGQFQHGAVLLVLVADEGERELAVRI